MKLISFAIPCYNSAAYMRNCIERILPGGEEVEIIIVDDGSKKDNTLEIAKEYEEKYPGICKAVHQENGGHGEAVNTGLRNASGLYFKVVDSDDWLDSKVLLEVLERIRNLTLSGESIDMLVANFIYDKVGQENKKVMSYANAFPEDKVFGWAEMKNFHLGQYILMHSVIYRTKMLKDCGLQLPKHTFYVDNLFVYEPLPHVKKIYYLNQNLYHYYIGREDQSVNETVMISRLDQQYRVNRLMIDCCDVLKVQPKKLRKYMILYLEIITTVSSVLAIKSGTEENLQRKKELWAELREKHFPLWWRMRSGFLGQGVNLPGKIGNKLTILAYKLTQKFYGFN
ncbi:glycosyltransferase family 2 protein [Oribacterium sinus]|uniref:glycosyltransferase family 2 protein n=1 Tax=Oribacterium sinus TaxID=237576 RepID=UPI0028E3E50C|nr:glycosyltransferase family 2 protein [Oribacterium sinus]